MKMKISEMRNVFAFCLGSLALLAGCGGFTEDVNGNIVEGTPADVNQMESRYARARFMESGPIIVDEVLDSVTLIYETIGDCRTDNGSFFYDPDYYYSYSRTYAYSFRGDTLLLTHHYVPDTYEVDQTEFDESFVLVGGTPGKLDGIWFWTQCRYREERMYCGNDSYDTYIKFDGGKMEYRIADRDSFDYIETPFMGELYRFMNDSYSTIDFDDIFYHDDTEYWRESNDISILDKTNRSVTYVSENRIFNLYVNYASYMDSVSVTLTSEGVTCVGEYKYIEMTPPELCNEDNAGYMWGEGTGHSNYIKTNRLEFEVCINGILGRNQE